MPTDPVALAADLIRCPSVTPEEGGAIALLAGRLAAAGFRTERADRGGIANLYARWGAGGPVLGFNGHTDVVPPRAMPPPGPTTPSAAWSPRAGCTAAGRRRT